MAAADGWNLPGSVDIEGEIQEISNLSSQLLEQAKQFRASRDKHASELRDISDKIQAMFKEVSHFQDRVSNVDISAYSDMVLAIVGSQDMSDMVTAEVSKAVEEIRTNLLLSKFILEADTYNKIWADLQNTLALTGLHIR